MYYLHKVAVRYASLGEWTELGKEKITDYVSKIDRKGFNPLHFGGTLFQ